MPFIGAVQANVRRRATGARGLDGRYVSGAETLIEDVWMNIDPIPGAQTVVSASGETLRDGRYLISEIELRTTDDYGDELADFVVYQGKTYQVFDRMDYPTVIPHFEYRAYRVRPRDEA